MNTSNSILELPAGASALPDAGEPDLAKIVAFFIATDRDFGAWSRDFNMHFGYHVPCVLWLLPGFGAKGRMKR